MEASSNKNSRDKDKDIEGVNNTICLRSRATNKRYADDSSVDDMDEGDLNLQIEKRPNTQKKRKTSTSSSVKISTNKDVEYKNGFLLEIIDKYDKDKEDYERIEYNGRKIGMMRIYSLNAMECICQSMGDVFRVKFADNLNTIREFFALVLRSTHSLDFLETNAIFGALVITLKQLDIDISTVCEIRYGTVKNNIYTPFKYLIDKIGELPSWLCS